MEEALLPDETKETSEIFPTSKSGQKTGSFNISAQELTDIVNKYKERDENMQDIKYFSQQGGINKLLEALQTDKINGISSKEGREEHFGSNKVFRKSPPTFCDFVKEAFEDKMIIILIFCSIFEIGISIYYILSGEEPDNKDYIDGISIIVAIFVVVSVGSITNYKKEMKFHDLNNIQNGTTTYDIIRNGKPEKIISDEILVGDLIKINYGDILPADMLMIEGNGIKIDESSLTGESNAMTKKPYEKCKEEFDQGNNNPSSMILLSGTNVIEGAGTAISIAIGEHSQKGIIRGTIDNAQEDNKTPLELKLNKIADLIGYFGLGSAIFTLIALVGQMIYRYCSGKEKFELSDMFSTILNIVILCVSIIVVAIPEGLPLAVTLSLSFSIKKLMDNNNLVRKMHACETMGGANVICTDKTGTLTLNLMSVTRLVTSNERIVINPIVNDEKIGVEGTKKKAKADAGKKRREDHSSIIENDQYWDILYTSISLNVDCTINKLSQPDSNGDIETFDTKNKTDKGFIEFLYQYKSPISVKKELYLSNPEFYQISPFDSKKKRMTTYVKNENFPTGYRLFTKGGAENAMIYCNRYINKNTGEVEELTEENKNFINNEIHEMNKKMMRTLYLSYRDIDEKDYGNIDAIDENGLLIDQKNLIFIGIFGLQDSLRPGVHNSVVRCHNAGVRVIMVTGDNIITATAIAKDCNIFPEKIDLDNLRDKDIEKNPSEINDPEKRSQHIEQLLTVRPYAITGNSFYSAIEGLFCITCGNETNLCKCPKSEAEAEELAKKGQPKLPVKKDAIKNIEAFAKISTNLLVMARSQPIHKYALVLGLKELGNVVAVTGDGTNDAPALSKSDVGFSMNDGTDIAKEASDIILMDNHFSSIVIAMIYGRSIYENLRKFLQFQLTVNFGACILVFLCSCIGSETPLASIQMLWVNLIMDSLGSLALATEPPYDELLERKPTNKNESIINGRMWKHIIFQSIFEIIILLILYLKAPDFIEENKGSDLYNVAVKIYDCFGINGTHYLPGKKTDINKILYGREEKWLKEIIFFNESDKDISFCMNQQNCTDLNKCKNCGNYTNCTKLYLDWNSPENLQESYNNYLSQYGGTTHMTLIFDVFVIYTLFNQINCRIIDDSLNIFKRISKGTLFCIVTLSELVIQIAISQIGGIIFHCVIHGLNLTQWLYCIGFSITTIIFNLIIKFIPLEKLIDPCTKGKIQQNAEHANSTIMDMINQNLKD